MNNHKPGTRSVAVLVVILVSVFALVVVSIQFNHSSMTNSTMKISRLTVAGASNVVGPHVHEHTE